ncbi:discoidin domain-containing protein [Bacteroides sp. 519]|uniref:discoidin domain-containing protein n=1 Tax=Bacteroides sp. 519 TaxID=2302937 RepID=UPI0013D714A9|nr:discoidin domain-containing protein [Bacteroides sp. 519]NDV57361.1 carbohydrate-binding protein [Bacteroides sp. 519]
MKVNLKHLIIILTLIGSTSCDDKLEPFENNGSTGAPVAISASAIQSEALPGAINLTWSAQPNDFAYMQVRYHDPLEKKDICKIFSTGATQLLVENTRARFGDYSFAFQTFNAANQSSAVTEVKAKSGAAPASYTEKNRTKVPLTGLQVSTDQADSSEGKVSNLIDDDKGSFFSSNWHNSGTTYPTYIQIDFDEPHENFAVKYINRTDDTWRESGRPAVVDLQVSNDGDNWTTVGTLSGMPTQAGSEYASPYFMPGESFTHFRFSVVAASGSASYFCISELMFYDVDIDIYDPETVPLD